MLDERRANVTVARENMQHASGQTCQLENARDDQPATDRRSAVRLQDDRISERERGRNRAHRQDNGEVERRDNADNTNGRASGKTQARLVRS